MTDKKDGIRPEKLRRGYIQDAAPDPWRVPVAVEQIPDTGLERTIVAGPAELAALAAVGGLRSVGAASASFTLVPMRDRNVHVTGRISARIGQTCVVTLEPMDSAIDEPIDLVFAPASQIPALAETIDDAMDGDDETPDPPEPITDGIIDIGRVATDALYLAVDPYPRKPDAVFDPPAQGVDPDDHPFAALKALQPAPGAPRKKPKGP